MNELIELVQSVQDNIAKAEEKSESVPDWNHIIPDKNMSFFIIHTTWKFGFIASPSTRDKWNFL